MRKIQSKKIYLFRLIYLYNSLKSKQSDNSLGNGGLTKEFYETFWNEQKEIFVDSASEAKEKVNLKDRLSLG